MTREEMAQSFMNAGWKIVSCSAHMLVGTAGNLSIRAHQWTWGTDDPVFELREEEKNLTYWVQTILKPRQAAILLKGRGGPPEEQRGNPYK